MTGAQVSAAGRVVVGVDGSEASTRAALYAAECARRRATGLLIVHVTPRQGAGDAVPMADREVQERFDASATALVQAAADAVRAGSDLTDVDTAVVDDYPVDGLLALSAGAALLVTGRRGAGGLPGLLLGSTAGALVQHAHCPVIALPDEVVRREDGRPEVVVGVEGGPGDAAVLAVAVAEATARGAVLTAVHAWRDLAAEAALGSFGPVVDWSVLAADQEQLLSEVIAPGGRRSPSW